jgi:hypothetical protein
MHHTRRAALLSLLASPLAATPQVNPPLLHIPPPLYQGEGPSRPNGKSKDEIAEENRKDLQDLLSTAQQLQDELKKAGSYVVPTDSIKKTKISKNWHGAFEHDWRADPESAGATMHVTAFPNFPSTPNVIDWCMNTGLSPNGRCLEGTVATCPTTPLARAQQRITSE